MKRLAIEAKVVERNEKAFIVKLKTGFGDPVLPIHKDFFSSLSPKESSLVSMRVKRSAGARKKNAALRALVDAANSVRTLAEGKIALGAIRGYDRALENLEKVCA